MVIGAMKDKLIRVSRESAKPGKGLWYCTVEDAVGLLDRLLPKLVQRRANRRARERLAKDARLTGSSGPLVRYRTGGTGSERPAPDSPPTSPPAKIQEPAK